MIDVSIIVPVYNVERFIAECLESLINQTFKRIEIIVINDGSTDNSLSIIKQFQKKDNRIKLINISNSGVSNARNLGLDNANGRYIAFVDSDDIIDSSMIEKMYEAAVANNADIVSTGYTKINIDGQPLSEHNPFLKEGEYNNAYILENVVRRYIGPTDEELRRVICGDYSDLITGYVCMNMYSASLLKINKIRFNSNLKMHEDDLFNLDAFYYSNKVVSINEHLYKYRQVQGSAMNEYKEWYVENKIQYYLAKKKYLQLNSDNKLYKECFINCIFVDLMGMVFNICRGSNSKSIMKKNREIKKIYKNELIINSISQNKKKIPSFFKVKGINNILKFIIWKLLVLRFTIPIVIIVSLRMNKK